ncbi:unnamed protein product [Ixodes pacificus]
MLHPPRAPAPSSPGNQPGGAKSCRGGRRTDLCVVPDDVQPVAGQEVGAAINVPQSQVHGRHHTPADGALAQVRRGREEAGDEQFFGGRLFLFLRRLRRRRGGRVPTAGHQSHRRADATQEEEHGESPWWRQRSCDPGRRGSER